jgi:hypothetical protein
VAASPCHITTGHAGLTLRRVLAETAVLPAMKSVSRRRPACLPIVHIYCAVVVAITLVENTKGLDVYSIKGAALLKFELAIEA